MTERNLESSNGIWGRIRVFEFAEESSKWKQVGQTSTVASFVSGPTHGCINADGSWIILQLDNTFTRANKLSSENV